MFQVAGETGNGVLEAACAAGIIGIGVDVDQYLSLNAANDPAYGCIVTSAEKHLETAVATAIAGDRRRHRQGRRRPVQREQRRHRRRARARQRRPHHARHPGQARCGADGNEGRPLTTCPANCRCGSGSGAAGHPLRAPPEAPSAPTPLGSAARLRSKPVATQYRAKEQPIERVVPRGRPAQLIQGASGT